MPAGLITRPVSDNRIAREVSGARLPATLGETLGATFTDPLLSPTALAVEQSRLDLLDLTPDEREQALRGEALPATRTRGAIPAGVNVPELSDLVNPEALNQEFGSLGLNFDKPRTRQYAEALAKIKREELIRNDIIARGPSGIGPATLKFGAALAGAALDPVNVASAFVPVISEARFAGLIAKLGKTNARLVKGFAEGSVGNALVEIPVYNLASGQQRDYEMSDALLNIALGGFLGGGLHAVGGRLADVIESRSPKVREEALRSAVAHMVDAKTPNVDPVFRFDEATFTPAGERASFQQRSGQKLQELQTELTGLAGEKLSRVEVQGLEAQVRELESRIKQSEESFQDVKKAVKREGSVRGRQAGPEAERRIQAEIEVIREPLEAAKTRLDRHRRAAAAESTLSRVEQRVRKGESPENILIEERKRLAQDLPDLDPDQFRVEIPAFNEDFIRPMTRAEIRQEAANVAKAEADPKRDITADFEASARADDTLSQQVGESAEAEADFAQEGIEALRAANMLTKEEQAELEQLAQFTQRAAEYERGVKAAARCLSR